MALKALNRRIMGLGELGTKAAVAFMRGDYLRAERLATKAERALEEQS